MERLRADRLHQGHNFDLVRGVYRREGGEEVERDVVEHPGSVAIVAHDEESVFLIRQPREAIADDALVEVPAGTLEPDEGALDCARRELREEAGLSAEHWEELHVVYPSPGYASEVQAIFLATGLSRGETEPDDDERIEVVPWPLAELDRAIRELRDATTLVGLMMLRERLR